MFPFPRTDLSHGFGDRDTGRSVTVQYGDPDLEFRDLTVEVAGHETLTQQFDTMHLRFDAARTVITTPSTDRQVHAKDAAERGRQRARPRYFDARRASVRATAPAVRAFHGLAFLRGGMTA